MSRLNDLAKKLYFNPRLIQEDISERILIAIREGSCVLPFSEDWSDSQLKLRLNVCVNSTWMGCCRNINSVTSEVQRLVEAVSKGQIQIVQYFGEVCVRFPGLEIPDIFCGEIE